MLVACLLNKIQLVVTSIRRSEFLVLDFEQKRKHVNLCFSCATRNVFLLTALLLKVVFFIQAQ
jgi:predicted membrane protein